MCGYIKDVENVMLRCQLDAARQSLMTLETDLLAHKQANKTLLGAIINQSKQMTDLFSKMSVFEKRVESVCVFTVFNCILCVCEYVCMIIM